MTIAHPAHHPHHETSRELRTLEVESASRPGLYHAVERFASYCCRRCADSR